MEAQHEQRPGHQRTRSRGLSFKSEKSQGSYKQPKIKVDSLHETADEKRKNHLSLKTKANPNAAMNEAQPIAAALEESTLTSLRGVQHRDANGNFIAEPDYSNPTRPRWERPLDTIRSFDKAIDNEFRRKQLIARADAFGDGAASRRSSYYGGYGDQQQQYPSSRYSQYGGGNVRGNRDSYSEFHVPAAGPSRNRYSQRIHSDLSLNRYSNMPNNGNGYPQGQPIYPNQGYQQSRATVNTEYSSGSPSEPWTNSTDPSSENSSLDRIHAAQKQYPDEQYAYPIHEDGEYAYPPPPSRGRALNGGGYFPQQGQYGTPPPPVPPHGAHASRSEPQLHKSLPRQPPMKLGGPVAPGAPPMPLGQTSGNMRPGLQPTKSTRKSWFKRRFSKD